METAGLHPIDYGVIAIYLAIVLLLGTIVGRKQKDTTDYFLAGRTMHWLPMGISIFASLSSALSYIGCPAEVFKHDLRMGLDCAAMFAVAPFVIILFVKFYHKLQVYTAYEYLEKRFNVGVRLMGSFLFMLIRFGWMASILYASGVVLDATCGIPVVYGILIAGVVATIYTVMGGMKAVIWTDVLQFIIFWGGLLVVMGIILYRIGGLGEFYRIASDSDKLRTFDFSISLTERATFWGVMIGIAFSKLGNAGVDQLTVQRFLTTKSVKDTKKGLYLYSYMILPLAFTFYLLGAMLFVFYVKFPEARVGLQSPDHVFPFFIVNELPYGLAGVLVAAIFAASMSSVDSGLNSITTAITTDFYKRLFQTKQSPRKDIVFARITTFVCGTITVIGGLLVNKYQVGTIFELFAKISSPVTGLLLGIFLLGILTKRGNVPGVIAGTIVGTIVIILMKFSPASWTEASPLINYMGRISFTWNTLIIFIATFVPGYLFSLITKPPTASHLEGYTLATVDK